MRSKIAQFFFRNSIHKFGRVKPFKTSRSPSSQNVPDFLQNTPRNKASGVLVTKTVTVTSSRLRPPLRPHGSPRAIPFRGEAYDPQLEEEMRFTRAFILNDQAELTRFQVRDESERAQKADALAKKLDVLAGRRRPSWEYSLFVTAHAPNDFLGFAEGWQTRVSTKTNADKIERFNRLRNSLDHYAAEFAVNKQARQLYRANYAEMRQIFFEIAADRYVPSPHDMEIW